MSIFPTAILSFRAESIGRAFQCPLHLVVLLVREARGAVLMVYLARSVAGAACAATGVAVLRHLPAAILAVVAMLLSVACVYIYNGLTDLEGDRLNSSKRPLASGQLSTKQAWAAIGGMVSGVLLLGVILPLGVTVCNVLMMALGALYSGGRVPAKMNSRGGLVVAALGSVLPYFSSAFAVSGQISVQTCVTASSFGLWVLAIGSTKDLSDVRGDQQQGRQTLAVRLGGARAKQVIVARAGALALVFTVVAATGIGSPVLFAGPACAILMWVTCLPMRVSGRASRETARRPYRAFMASQFLFNGLLIGGSLL